MPSEIDRNAMRREMKTRRQSRGWVLDQLLGAISDRTSCSQKLRRYHQPERNRTILRAANIDEDQASAGREPTQMDITGYRDCRQTFPGDMGIRIGHQMILWACAPILEGRERDLTNQWPPKVQIVHAPDL